MSEYGSNYTDEPTACVGCRFADWSLSLCKHPIVLDAQKPEPVVLKPIRNVIGAIWRYQMSHGDSRQYCPTKEPTP